MGDDSHIGDDHADAFRRVTEQLASGEPIECEFYRDEHHLDGDAVAAIQKSMPWDAADDDDSPIDASEGD